MPKVSHGPQAEVRLLERTGLTAPSSGNASLVPTQTRFENTFGRSEAEGMRSLMLRVISVEVEAV
jgi:hypothetical protein